MQLLHLKHMEPSKARACLCSAHSSNILMGMHLEKASVPEFSTWNAFNFWLLSKSHRNRGEDSSLFYVHSSLSSSAFLLSGWILCCGSQSLLLSTWRVWAVATSIYQLVMPWSSHLRKKCLVLSHLSTYARFVDSLHIVPAWEEVRRYNLHFFNPTIMEDLPLRTDFSICFRMLFCLGAFLMYHLIRHLKLPYTSSC